MNRFPRLVLALILCAPTISRSAQSETAVDQPDQLRGIVKAAFLRPVSWTGFYVGADFGNASDAFDFEDTSESFAFNGFRGKVPLGSTRGDDSLLAGGQIGYNQQFGRLVVGLESDANWVSFQGEVIRDRFFFGNAFPLGALVHATRTAKLDLACTVRPRVGLSWNSFLFYATGGLALGNITVQAHDFSAVQTLLGSFQQVGSGSDSGVATGWAAGGGVEWSPIRAISIGAEYQHFDIGGSYNPTSDGQLFNAKGRVDFSDDQVLLRLNIHLKAFFRH